MPFSVAMIGAGQFSGSFAHLFDLHPGVSKVYATDVLPERADELVAPVRAGRHVRLLRRGAGQP